MAVRSRSAQVLAAIVASGTAVFGLAAHSGAAAGASAPPAALNGSQHHVCATPLPGTVACHAIVLTPATSPGKVAPAKRWGPTTSAPPTTAPATTAPTTAPATTAPTTTPTTTPTTVAPTTAAPAACAFSAKSGSPAGYAPCDLQSAYSLFSASASVPPTPPTVAIVDAYDDSTAAADLATYRTQFGLPPCGTGCFTKVNQSGGAAAPANNTSWAQEISLDLDMVSATCPYCHILLVEANSNSYGDLFAAENTAYSMGATAISNSWGGGEFSGETNYDLYFNHPGVAITVSAGDKGYGVEYPAASPYVTAVGGTSLVRSGTGWAETVWSGAGSGCSAYEPQPTWQANLGLAGCANRIVGDVAAVADPNTGVAVYDTDGAAGWLIFGGTSVAAPVIASVYAMAGNPVTSGSYPYSHTSGLTDVTSGTNSSTGCSVAYLCTGRVGYDGPTGMGTPKGTSGF